MYSYEAYVSRVIDGDTVVLDIDLGFKVILRQVRCRLIGINTPETRGKNKCEAGERAKITVANDIQGTFVNIRSYKDETTDINSDSFGRWLVRIYLRDGTDYNQSLIDRGFAVPYLTEKDNTKE